MTVERRDIPVAIDREAACPSKNPCGHRMVAVQAPGNSQRRPVFNTVVATILSPFAPLPAITDVRYGVSQAIGVPRAGHDDVSSKINSLFDLLFRTER